MKSSNLKEKLDNLPQTPGSYIFKDISGKVIYIGKAKNLKHRIKSYFALQASSDFKTSELVKRINDLDFIKVDSEYEAIILEAELIKKYKPKYNIVLKDDRSKIYIVIRNDQILFSGKKYLLPKIITTRKPEILPSDIVFGPYPNNTVVKKILETSRKIFPFRDCNLSKFAKYRKDNAPCLYGHIGICPSPCVFNNPENLKNYQKNISGLKKILSGKSSGLIKDIEKNMKISSIKENFEEAVNYRDLLEKFYYVQKTFREAEEYINNPFLIDDIRAKSIKEIKDFLPFLKNPPKRIECYDISNISGKEAVGSMVVAIDGRIEKSEYKRFRIKFKQAPDDFGMMYEVLLRRLKRETLGKNEKSWGIPDLIILDGGKPQVSAGIQVLKDLNLNIPLVGLAKKYESLVYKERSDFVEKQFSKDSFGMKLIINLRNESHRFAQSYHHLLRKKSFLR